MDGAILAAVMVAGQYSTQDLQQTNSSSSSGGVELILSPLNPKRDHSEELLQRVFKLVHEKFRPELAYSTPVKQQCRPVYRISVTCECGAPLSFAVRSSQQSVTNLRQLLTEDLKFMCPGCYYRHGE